MNPASIKWFETHAPARVVVFTDELPEVTYSKHDSGVNVAGGFGWWGPSVVPTNEYALAIIAANNHIALNPPVDEAAVQALAHTIGNIGCDWSEISEGALARRLYLAGVRIEATK